MRHHDTRLLKHADRTESARGRTKRSRSHAPSGRRSSEPLQNCRAKPFCCPAQFSPSGGHGIRTRNRQSRHLISSQAPHQFGYPPAVGSRQGTPCYFTTRHRGSNADWAVPQRILPGDGTGSLETTALSMEPDPMDSQGKNRVSQEAYLRPGAKAAQEPLMGLPTTGQDGL